MSNKFNPIEFIIYKTEEEFKQEVGKDVATVISLGLEAYAGAYTGQDFKN